MDIKNFESQIGVKYYKFNDSNDVLDVIRICNIDRSKKTITVFKNESNKKEKISLDDISQYRKLKPDGMIIFSIVSMPSDSQEPIYDILVAFGRSDAYGPNDGGLPYAICRQLIYDVFSNMLIQEQAYDRCKEMLMGMSISQDTCPANINFRDILSCSGINYSKPVSIYLDDTLDTILKLFNNSKFDTELKKLYNRNYSISGYNSVGYSSSLRELLEKNNFMYDFRKAFNIMEVPFLIDEDLEELSSANIGFIENELKINIIKTYIIKFTKEINLNEIKRDYILISSAHDKFNKVYIMAFDKQD